MGAERTKRGMGLGRRVAAAAALVSLSGLGAAALAGGPAAAGAVRAPGQVNTATANACAGCYNHNEEPGRDDA